MATGWITRPERATDATAVRDVNLAAFDTATEADLVDALRSDDAWIPGLSYVTESPGGALAGFALLTRCHVDDAPALALAPCAVHPDHQRRGAGTAVIGEVLDAARRRGEHLVVVLGHPAYYPRFGFTPASRFDIRAPVDVPDDAFMALRLHERAPAPTGVVGYPAVFGL